MIKPKIKEPKFLRGTGLGNEINFRIFDYDPKDELIVREHVKRLVKDFNSSSDSNRIIEFDLYKMLIQMTKEDGVFDELFNYEEENGKDDFFDAIREMASPKVFIEKIKQGSINYDILFITGIGKIFPFIRSHTILNKLHEAIEGKPVVMFYPGSYSGQELILFNKIKDGNYYRAFPLIDRKLGG